MSDVQSLATEFSTRFALAEGAVEVQRATRMWVEVERAVFPEVFDYIVKSLGFSILCTITGLDLGADLGFIYHLARDGGQNVTGYRDRGVMINLKTRCPKTESMHTVTAYFPCADIYERELIDLFGARIDGLPDGPRYPLPEDWPEGDHPLLKDWKPKTTEAPAPTAEAPAPTTEAPAPTTEAPAPTTEAPAPTTEAPAPTTEAPAPTTEAPAPTAQAEKGAVTNE
jgi:membrane-bound hydrogenase subunit beta